MTNETTRYEPAATLVVRGVHDVPDQSKGRNLAMTKPRAFVLPSMRIAVRSLLDGLAATRHRLPPTLFVAAAIVLAAASGARAHTDPPGCSFTGVALLIQTFRADGITPLIGSV